MLRSLSYSVLRNICFNQCARKALPQSASSAIVVSFHRSRPVEPRLHYQPERGSQWSAEYIRPIFYEEDEEYHVKNGSLEAVPFTPVKAALLKQNCSVFNDRQLIRFLGFMTKKGKRFLARTLMEDTFFELKASQMARIKILEEAEKKLAAQVDKEQEKEGQGKSGKYYDLLELREKIKSTECNPLAIFHRALENCMMSVETRPIKRGGAIYQVPFPLTKSYSEFRAMQWIINSVVDRPKPRYKHFPKVMARELLAAYNNDGQNVKKKQDMHRNADANKAYAHYRWG